MEALAHAKTSDSGPGVDKGPTGKQYFLQLEASGRQVWPCYLCNLRWRRKWHLTGFMWWRQRSVSPALCL